jgi:hypothetical protein
MDSEFYVFAGGERKGPYDILGLMRKIRNGSLTSVMLVEREGGPRFPAIEWPELREFFETDGQLSGRSHAIAGVLSHGFLSMLRKGVRFLADNPVTTISSSILLLFVIFMTVSVHLLPAFLHPYGYAAHFFATYFLVCCYQYHVLRVVRGQPADWNHIKPKLYPVLPRLAGACAFSSAFAILGMVLLIQADGLFVSILGLLIFTLPGLFMLSLHAFASFLIIDQDYAAGAALARSRARLLEQGAERIGSVLALFVIDFIGALLILLPLAITLPVTMSILSEMYDEDYS